MTFLAKLLRAYVRSGLRGHTWATSSLAHRVKSLQAVPVSLGDCPTLYVDLRDGFGHYLLGGHPWASPPWEADEQAVMRRIVRAGDVAFDIGANMGAHSVLLSKLVGPRGRLCLFEPNPQLHTALARTVRELGNASLHAWALSNECVDATLFVPADHRKASLADWTDERIDGRARAMTCPQGRIDDLVRDGVVPRPDFIKCDVEGAELLVFQGARAVLDRGDAPSVLFEANTYNARGFGLAVSDAKRFLEGLAGPRYRFFAVVAGGALAPLKALDPVHSNVLAVPAARESPLAVVP